MTEASSGVPATAIAAIIAALLTATLTFLGVYLTNRGNNKRLKEQLDHEKNLNAQKIRIEKLEELYLLAEGWVTSLASYYLPYTSVMQGKISYDEALTVAIEDGKNNAVDFKKLQMLVDLHFPEIQENFTQLLECRQEVNDIMFSHKKDYMRGATNGEKYLLPFVQFQQKLEQEAQNFKLAIIQLNKAI
ncbi:hypothetical protein [Thalassomonas actiniarum]|uniref:Uncharacterized protein n=1 Tax=Thalassomonas actiniarum TaxID=485447 RepID=A0AAE9YVB9_9GAMM|nr:hypothetical protein [Thalassomonas actiniarum]WDE01009.1 hypothetical protein SG35_010455 [Thalassomonas actiniarum]